MTPGAAIRVTLEFVIGSPTGAEVAGLISQLGLTDNVVSTQRLDHTPGPSLSEADHPYYWNSGCFFSNECHRNHESWQAYMKGWGAADRDMNCVYRWDWRLPWPGVDPPVLMIYMVMQRKAYPMSHAITITPEDEKEVRAYLRVRWQHVRRIWAPFSDIPPREANGGAWVDIPRSP